MTVDLNFNTGDFTSTETTVTFTSGDTSEEVTITARNVTADAVKTITYTVSVADTDTSDGQRDGLRRRHNRLVHHGHREERARVMS